MPSEPGPFPGDSPAPRFAALVGPTASGKSSLALFLAGRFRGEILSADSMQVYRKMDIGTAKPSREEREQVPHHLIDVVDPDQDYNAALFREQAGEIILRLHRHGTPIFVVGGTGLYLKALTRGLFSAPGADPVLRGKLMARGAREGSSTLHRQLRELDPEAAARIHPQDLLRIVRALEIYARTRRPISHLQRAHAFGERPYAVLKIGLAPERSELYRSIESRVERMMAAGWIEEVRTLLSSGYGRSLKSMQAIGYRHLAGCLCGESGLAETLAAIKRDTRRLAKRQLTWFRADREIHWFDPGRGEAAAEIEGRVRDFFASAYSRA
jgi:tRNA dimethylallyltransferase